MGSSGLSFDSFVRASAGDLLRTACLITWDDAEAEDLVQECLLQVSRHWRRVAAMEMPLAYARRILINLALGGRDKRSRRREELAFGSVGGDGQPEDWLDGVDSHGESLVDILADRAELMSALAALTPHQRAVLVLRYFNDLSEAQVAELLGCGTGTVKASASRGLAHLRTLIPPRTSTTEVCEP